MFHTKDIIPHDRIFWSITLIYVNDLALMCSNVLPIMYADDFNPFKEGSNIVEIQSTINDTCTKYLTCIN